MILFNLRIPDSVDDTIDKFVELGLYPNRSECARNLLREGIKNEWKELHFSKEIKNKLKRKYRK